MSLYGIDYAESEKWLHVFLRITKQRRKSFYLTKNGEKDKLMRVLYPNIKIEAIQKKITKMDTRKFV